MSKRRKTRIVEMRRRLERSAALRRQLSLRQPIYFDSRYCGMRWAEHREVWLNAFTEAFAEARSTLGTDSPQKGRLLVLAPRDHGKTEAAITFTTQLICFDRNIRVLFIGETEKVAQKRVGRVKDLLKSERIQQDWCSDPDNGFGPFTTGGNDDGTKWDAGIVKVLRSLNSVDPTLEAVGMGGAVTGGHFDVIVADDPETLREVRSAAVRKHKREWMLGEIQPMLAPGGVMIVIGTRKHHDDLYAHLKRSPSWKILEHKAIQEWPDKAEPVYELDEHGREILKGWSITGSCKVLWPQERPIEYLLSEREGMRGDDGMGYTQFAREYQQEVQDEGSVIFKREWLEAAVHRGKALSFGLEGPWPDGLLMVQAWDPAFVLDEKRAERSDSDYCTGVGWAACVRTRTRYLFDMSRERGQSAINKKRNVIRFWRKYAAPESTFDLSMVDHVTHGWPIAVAMERNNAGGWMKTEIEEDADIPLIGHWTGKEVNDVYRGVPGLSSLFERGRVVLPYGDIETKAQVDILVQEFHGLGSEAHDDIVLAIWIAEVLLRRCLKAYDEYIEEFGVPAAPEEPEPQPQSGSDEGATDWGWLNGL